MAAFQVTTEATSKFLHKLCAPSLEAVLGNLLVPKRPAIYWFPFFGKVQVRLVRSRDEFAIFLGIVLLSSPVATIVESMVLHPQRVETKGGPSGGYPESVAQLDGMNNADSSVSLVLGGLKNQRWGMFGHRS